MDYVLKRLGVEAVITADKEELQSADKVIFPGVGEAETTMNHLKATGLDELIKMCIRDRAWIPFRVYSERYPA